MFFLTHWPRVDDFADRRWLFEGFDKLVHFCLYAGWVVAWCWLLAAGGRPLGRAAVGWLIAGGAAYAFVDEMTQAIVGRQPDILDFACDMAGAAAALALVYFWPRRRPAGRTRPISSRA